MKAEEESIVGLAGELSTLFKHTLHMATDAAFAIHDGIICVRTTYSWRIVVAAGMFKVPLHYFLPLFCVDLEVGNTFLV